MLARAGRGKWSGSGIRQRLTPPATPLALGGDAERTDPSPQSVEHLLNRRYDEGMPGSIGFRPTQDDERILREAARVGESTSDTLRRALRLLDHEEWLTQFRADAETLKDEDLNTEPEAW